jgi:hypothetical protein
VVVAIHTLIQTRTPPHLVGRTASATEVVVAMPQTLSIGLGALAVARVDYRLLLVAMVVVLAGCGATLLRRRIDDEQPTDSACGSLPMRRDPHAETVVAAHLITHNG